MHSIWKISYTFEDEKHQRATTSLYVSPTSPYADVSDFADAMTPLIRALITGALVRTSISSITEIDESPNLGSDVEEKAEFFFSTYYGIDPDLHRFFLTIPAIDESIFTIRGDVDESNPDAAAFIAAMIDGIEVQGGEVTVHPTDERGEQVITYDGAGEVFRPRKRRKRRWLP